MGDRSLFPLISVLLALTFLIVIFEYYDQNIRLLALLKSVVHHTKHHKVAKYFDFEIEKMKVQENLFENEEL